MSTSVAIDINEYLLRPGRTWPSRAPGGRLGNGNVQSCVVFSWAPSGRFAVAGLFVGLTLSGVLQTMMCCAPSGVKCVLDAPESATP